MRRHGLFVAFALTATLVMMSVGPASAAAQSIPTGVQRTFADDNPNLGIGGPDDIRVDTDIAIIGTGVADHPDLNVASRTDCTSGSCQDGSGNDDNGHGTHLAGTIGAINNDIGVVGLAPGARIHGFKVCDATGACSIASIVAAINAVTARADEIEVVNISLGGPGTNDQMAEAITASVAAGVVYVVSAGAGSKDASDIFPANHPDVITVSALADSDGEPGGQGGPPPCSTSNNDDELAAFSNFGSVVEVAAPGVCIDSTWNHGGYRTLSGTAMASAHVTGAAGILTSGPNSPSDRPGVRAVRQKIIDTGNFDWTDTSGDGVREPLLDVHDPSEYPPG